ncbi:MAG: hypothetical protein HKN58_03800 [Xanthomonadales bacterium]|nr:hypothetical protein [Xanthomonadales bacterium]
MKKWALILVALAVLPAAALSADRNKAQVVTFKSDPTKCLASVEIKTIDGELKLLPSLGFDIEPGWHTMHGVATVNLNHCPAVEERSRKQVHIPPLEWLFEAGKKYYVGLDHSSPHRENWQLVVWKVESMDEEEAEG